MFKKASINKFAMKIAEDTYIDILANRLASEMSKRYEMKLGKIKFIFESYGQLDILFDGHLYSILNRLQMENVQKFVNLNKVPANDVTVFYPFIATEEQHNEPNSVALEYMYMKEQEIKITR